MYELLFRRTLIFGVPAVPFVPFRVQLLVQSSVLYLPLHRRFYCDRLDRFLPPFPLPYFPFPVSLILSSLKSSAVTAPNVSHDCIYSAHIFIPLRTPTPCYHLIFSSHFPQSLLFSSLLFRLFFLHPCTFPHTGAILRFNEIFAIDLQFVSRTLQKSLCSKFEFRI